MRFALFIVFVFAGALCKAQPANIGLKNGTRVKVFVTTVTDIQVFTDSETYNLEHLQAIYFWEEQPDSIAILTLRANGVAVYLKNKRLAPIPKPRESKAIREVENSNASLGIGGGLDYGGLGARFSLLPSSVVGLFVGAGYNLDKLGYNVGLDIKFTPRQRTTGFFTAMYGYNAVLLEDYDDNEGKTYYGMSVGMGFKIVNKANGKDYINLMFIVPFRHPEVKEIIKT